MLFNLNCKSFPHISKYNQDNRSIFPDLTERVTALEDVTSQMSGDITMLQATTDDFDARIQELESAISGN